MREHVHGDAETSRRQLASADTVADGSADTVADGSQHGHTCSLRRPKAGMALAVWREASASVPGVSSATTRAPVQGTQGGSPQRRAEDLRRSADVARPSHPLACASTPSSVRGGPDAHPPRRVRSPFSASLTALAVWELLAGRARACAITHTQSSPAARKDAPVSSRGSKRGGQRRAAGPSARPWGDVPPRADAPARGA
eukprot:CAMPEP_0115878172 /NCGR_PEP_ID=MMETSP0287-20121206/26630_1 /TAXON_ID=412157 /ORGANISM="Chrysochromulina rotalis, Strain UIO044" /LENGTH=198 /DNA_ID=CAMNT_0003333767 /DNA_START=46 /DNA_END=641 /DNA_ORIENTATION=+